MSKEFAESPHIRLQDEGRVCYYFNVKDYF